MKMNTFAARNARKGIRIWKSSKENLRETDRSFH